MMESTASRDDEEMKFDEEIPLLRKISSHMEVDPYSRITSLANMVKLLQTCI